MAGFDGRRCDVACVRAAMEIRSAMDWAEAVSASVADCVVPGEREMWAWGFVEAITRLDVVVRDLVACVERVRS